MVINKIPNSITPAITFQFQMSKQIDPSILQLYHIKKFISSGAYGHVWKVVENASGRTLALKKNFQAFHSDTDAQRTYRQISALHELSHPNIIKLHRVHRSSNNRDLYLVFDLMDGDLLSLIGQGVLNTNHIKYITFQVLRAFQYLHSADLVHRDIKPSNILINSNCQIKLCDFGLVKSLKHEEDQQIKMTDEVATRWYRSPQMLLSSKVYGKETDVWSLGCIIAEILCGEPIFQGGSVLNQLQKILAFTGILSEQDIKSIQSPLAMDVISKMNIVRQPLPAYFKSKNQQINQLVLKMLQFNPKKRIKVEEALNLDIFKDFRKKLNTNGQICHRFVVMDLSDNFKFSANQYMQKIYIDIERRYPKMIVFKPFSRSTDRKQMKKSHLSLSKRNDYSFSVQKRKKSLHMYNSFIKTANSHSMYFDSIKTAEKLKQGFIRQNSHSLKTHNKLNKILKDESSSKRKQSNKLAPFNLLNIQKMENKHYENSMKKMGSRKTVRKQKKYETEPTKHNMLR